MIKVREVFPPKSHVISWTANTLTISALSKDSVVEAAEALTNFLSVCCISESPSCIETVCSKTWTRYGRLEKIKHPDTCEVVVEISVLSPAPGHVKLRVGT
jgi:hypothetical protein